MALLNVGQSDGGDVSVGGDNEYKGMSRSMGAAIALAVAQV